MCTLIMSVVLNTWDANFETEITLNNENTVQSLYGDKIIQ